MEFLLLFACHFFRAATKTENKIACAINKENPKYVENVATGHRVWLILLQCKAAYNFHSKSSIFILLKAIVWQTTEA